MKKLISLTLAIIVILSLAVPALAATPTDQSGTTTIKTVAKDAYYELVIPASIDDLPWGTTEKELGAFGISNDPAKTKLEPGKVVSVTTTKTNLTNGASVIEFTLDNTTGEFTIASATKTMTMSITAQEWIDANAGQHTGSIVFTAKYGDPATT